MTHPTINPPCIALVIEDEPAIRSLLVTMLSELDCAVLASESGTQLRERLDMLRPDVIFLDIGLPGSDVSEILESLAACRYAGRIQIVSGQPMGVVTGVIRLGESLGLGMLAPILKPFRMADLEALVAGLPRVAVQAKGSEIEQRSWLKMIGSDPGLIDLRLRSETGPADQLGWWFDHGSRYTSSLLGFPATSSFTVETIMADVLDLSTAMGHFAPGAFRTMPTIIVNEDDVFSDVEAARLDLEVARRAGFVVRMTGCGTRFFAMAGHRPLAVDQAEIGSFLSPNPQDHAKRFWHLAEIAHRAGTILLADDYRHPQEGAQSLGLDLWRSGSEQWLPVADQTPISTPQPLSDRRAWRLVSVRDALALRKAC